MLPFKRTALLLYREDPSRSVQPATDSAGGLHFYNSSTFQLSAWYEDMFTGPLWVSVDSIRQLPPQELCHWLGHYMAGTTVRRDQFSVRAYEGTNKILNLLSQTQSEYGQLQGLVHIHRVEQHISKIQSSVAWLPVSCSPEALHRVMNLFSCALVDAWDPAVLRKLATDKQKGTLLLLKSTLISLGEKDADCQQKLDPLSLLVFARDTFCHDLEGKKALNVKMAMVMLGLLDPDAQFDRQSAYIISRELPELFDTITAKKKEISPSDFKSFLKSKKAQDDVANAQELRRNPKFWEVFFSQLVPRLSDTLRYISKFRSRLLDAAAKQEATATTTAGLSEAKPAKATQKDTHAAQPHTPATSGEPDCLFAMPQGSFSAYKCYSKQTCVFLAHKCNTSHPSMLMRLVSISVCVLLAAGKLLGQASGTT